jgi:hypothetical protein
MMKRLESANAAAKAHFLYKQATLRISEFPSRQTSRHQRQTRSGRTDTVEVLTHTDSEEWWKG